MSLKAKIASIVSVLIVLVSAAGAVIQHSVFSDVFEELEREEAVENLEELTRAFESEARDLDRIAAWYATWATAADPDQSARAVATESVLAQDLDLLIFCDVTGEITSKVLLDPDSHTPIALDEFPQVLSLQHPALGWSDAMLRLQGRRSRGVMSTSSGPICLAAVGTSGPNGAGGGSDTEAEPTGFVIAGRFVRGSIQDRILAQTGQTFDFWQLEDTEVLPEDVRSRLDRITSAADPVVDDEFDPAKIVAYSTLDDILQRPAFVLRAHAERRISAIGSTAMASGSLLDATMGFLVLLCLILTLNKIVLRPIEELTQHAEKTGADENFRARIGSERQDELGALGRGFDEMMSRLEKARSELLDTARTAGKSELATGILHNVGNVLNSVNISASLIGQRLDELCIRDLERLAEVLAQHADDLPGFLVNDPRGKHIEPFLSSLVAQLQEERSSIRHEVASLADGIDHICELIKSQQGIAKKTSLLEYTSLAERFDEALMITQKAQGDSSKLVVMKRYEELPEIEIDKHRLLEILVNLIQNARQATSGPSQEVVLELRGVEDGMVAFSVADNGCGIAKDDLIRIFSLGFTTRDDGHGFGLHSCANVAKEMGGSLRVESDGVGRGACFTLEVPSTPPCRAKRTSGRLAGHRGGVA